MPKSKWEKVGEVAVDAGIIMLGDPCYHIEKAGQYIPDDWSTFCDAIGNSDVHNFEFSGGHTGAGVVVSSGFGDGIYDVFIRRDTDTGRVAEVKVVFI